jgi:hypothetical protein
MQKKTTTKKRETKEGEKKKPGHISPILRSVLSAWDLLRQ